LVGTQVIIREASIIRKATFLEVDGYIKANHRISKLQFGLPQTIFKINIKKKIK